MGKGSLCLDNRPARKISFISTHSLESKTKRELLLLFGGMKHTGLSAEMPGCVTGQEKGRQRQYDNYNEVNHGYSISRSKGTKSRLITFEQESKKSFSHKTIIQVNFFKMKIYKHALKNKNARLQNQQ